MRVEKIEVIGESLWLHLSWPRVGEAKIILFRADGQARFCGTRRVSIVAEGSTIPRAYFTVMRKIAASLGDTTIDELYAIGAPTVQDTHESPINTWGGKTENELREYPKASRTFFCDHAIMRKLYESFRFEGPSSCIVHGDLECSFITPRSRVPLPRFFNYPSPLQGDAERFGATTDLGDLDVIKGGAEKLRHEILKEIEAIRDAGPVTVNTTCIPTVIGDDVEGIVSEHARMTRHGVWVVGPRTIEPVELYIRYLEKMASGHNDTGRDGCIALVGFPEGQAIRELVDLLATGGIKVSGLMLPVASESRMRSVLDAKVIVFRPSSHLNPLYERIFAKIERVKIAPEAPWGLGATASWLREVGKSIGRDMGPVVSEGLSRIATKWEGLREEVLDGAVAFIIDPQEVDRLLDPHSMTGLPVVRVTREMGFSVRILVYSGKAALYRDCRDRLEAAFKDLDVTIQGFSSPEELARGLREPVPAIVYSEFFYDRRVTRLGLNVFSSREFEMGFDGAVRTLSRLARLAKTPFYRRYAGHFGSASNRWWWG